MKLKSVRIFNRTFSNKYVLFFSPDLETCNGSTYNGKHRLSADAILEATSLVHDNAAFDNYNSHQALNSLQI